MFSNSVILMCPEKSDAVLLKKTQNCFRAKAKHAEAHDLGREKSENVAHDSHALLKIFTKYLTKMFYVYK